MVVIAVTKERAPREAVVLPFPGLLREFIVRTERTELSVQVSHDGHHDSRDVIHRLVFS